MILLRVRFENAPARTATASTRRTRAQNIEFMHDSSDPAFLCASFHSELQSQREQGNQNMQARH